MCFSLGNSESVHLGRGCGVWGVGDGKIPCWNRTTMGSRARVRVCVWYVCMYVCMYTQMLSLSLYRRHFYCVLVRLEIPCWHHLLGSRVLSCVRARACACVQCNACSLSSIGQRKEIHTTRAQVADSRTLSFALPTENMFEDTDGLLRPRSFGL